MQIPLISRNKLLAPVANLLGNAGSRFFRRLGYFGARPTHGDDDIDTVAVNLVADLYISRIADFVSSSFNLFIRFQAPAHSFVFPTDSKWKGKVPFEAI